MKINAKTPLVAIIFVILISCLLYGLSVLLQNEGTSSMAQYKVTSVKVFEPASQITEEVAPSVSDKKKGSVDISGKYYRSLLSDEEKEIYDQLYNGFLANTRSVDIIDCAPDVAERCYKYVLYDEPDIFWVDTSYQYMITQDRQTVVSIQPDYIYKPQEIESARKKIKEATDEILKGLPGEGATDYDKAAYIFSSLSDLLSYDEAMADTQDLATVFTKKITACGGYSKAYQYICRQAGIDTVYMVGNADVGETQILHAWNMQNLDGVICYADSTWGDKEERLPVDLSWLGLSYPSISASHELLEPAAAVKSEDGKYEIWTLMDSSFDAFDEQTVLTKLIESVERDDKAIVMHFTSQELLEQALDAIKGNTRFATQIYERFPDKFPVAFTEGVYKSYKIGDLCALKVIWGY